MIKKKLDSTLNQQENWIDDYNDDFSPKFEECNRNLVEELCGASINDIAPFNLGQNQDTEYSIISPN